MATMASTTQHSDLAPQDPTAAPAAPDTVAAAPAPARPAGQKLRDCCQSCARSKVRCTKEKPSCSRCESKGIPCRYLQSKRPGRIPGSGARRQNLAARNEYPRSRVVADAGSLASSTPPPHESDAADHAAGPPLTAASTVSLASVGLDSSHRRTDSLFDTHFGAFDPIGSSTSTELDFEADVNVPFVWDDCFDALATMDDPMYANLMDWDQTSSTLSMNLPLDPGVSDGVPAYGNEAQSPASLLLPGASHVQTLSRADTDTDTLVSSSTSSKSSSSTSLALSSSSYSSFMDRPSLTTRVSSSAMSSSATSSSGMHSRKPTLSGSPQPMKLAPNCSCLHSALDLLKAVTTEDLVSEPTDASETLNAQAILAKNKETIQATLAILACVSCQDDRFLMMVALLIAMKMVPRYASAAAASSNPPSRPTTAVEPTSHPSGSTSPVLSELSDRNSPRHAKQQVLRELHLVQRLITQLSSRLKRLSESGQRASHATNSLMEGGLTLPFRNSSQKSRMNNGMSATSESASSMPISTRALDVVEGDVRNSLSSLSAVVRNALKDS